MLYRGTDPDVSVAPLRNSKIHYQRNMSSFILADLTKIPMTLDFENIKKSFYIYDSEDPYFTFTSNDFSVIVLMAHFFYKKSLPFRVSHNCIPGRLGVPENTLYVSIDIPLFRNVDEYKEEIYHMNTLIELISKLSIQVPDTGCKICGSNEKLLLFPRLCNSHIGFLSYQDLAKFYAFPSRSFEFHFSTSLSPPQVIMHILVGAARVNFAEMIKPTSFCVLCGRDLFQFDKVHWLFENLCDACGTNIDYKALITDIENGYTTSRHYNIRDYIMESE